MKDVSPHQFSDIEVTAIFCATINDAFNILNSRVLFHKDEKKVGISKSNISTINYEIEKIILNVKALKCEDGSLVINSRKYTGFLGLIVSLTNVLRIFADHFQKLNGHLLTYKLSQDHLEVFFSAVRSKGGYSNNPTAYQFINIYKKLLVHADGKSSEHANCLCLDDTELLKISPNFTLNNWLNQLLKKIQMFHK